MVPRSETIEFKGVVLNREQIDRFPEVTHVLDGTVATSGQKILLDTRLRSLREGSETTLWEQTSETTSTNLFAMIGKHKRAVMSAMNVPTNETERRILSLEFTPQHEAFLKYAEGMAKIKTGHWNDFAEAVKLQRAALEIDPSFIEAQEQYAFVNFYAWYRNWNIVRFNLHAFDDATQTVSDILASDPLNSIAMVVKVRILLNSGRRQEALSLARGAVFQNKDEPRFHSLLAHALTADGQYREAEKAIDAFLELSPRLTALEVELTAWRLLRMGLPERALTLLDDETLRSTQFESINSALLYAEALSRIGRKEEAREHAGRAKQDYRLSNLSFVEPQFRIYKDPKVYEDYFEALNAVGIPRYAFGLDEKWAEHLMTGEELRTLFQFGFETVETIDPVGGSFTSLIQSDGSITVRYAFLPGMVFDGVWEIEGDAICTVFEAIWMGHRVCYPYYYDPERSKANEPRYAFLNGFGPHYFGVRRLDH